jgi:Domain of unknown function (DUF3597)
MLDKLIGALVTLFEGPKPKDEIWGELDKRVAESGEKLEPRKGIVDLLKSLKMDSSDFARHRLWLELGFLEAYTGTADQNEKLHRAVLEKVAKRGIRI